LVNSATLMGWGSHYCDAG